MDEQQPVPNDGDALVRTDDTSVRPIFALTLCATVFATIFYFATDSGPVVDDGAIVAAVAGSERALGSSRARALEALELVNEKQVERGLTNAAAVTGKLILEIADNFEAEEAMLRGYVVDYQRGRVFEIDNPRAAAAVAKTGDLVSLDATIKQGNIAALNGDEGSVAVIETAQFQTVGGERSVLVIPANFSDRNLACSQSQLESLIFSNQNNIHSGFNEASNGGLSYVGDVLPVTNVPYSYTEWSGLSYTADMITYAESQGFAPSSYDHVIFVLPDNSNSIAGQAHVGGRYSYSWACGNTMVYSHEIGHNLGMAHAGVLGGSQYSDGSDIMGNRHPGFNDVNAPHKYQMGWLPTTALVEGGNGTYLLTPTDVAPTGDQVQILRLARPSTANDAYYVSYREGEGISSYLGSPYDTAVNIHRYTGSPDTGGYALTTFVQALAPGQTFTDGADGISVTYQGLEGGAASVRVSKSCAAIEPAVRVVPQRYSALTPETATFEVTITNPANGGCNTGDFTLGVSAPAGWLVDNPFGTQRISDGDSVVALVGMTPSSSTALGVYPLQFTATNVSLGLSASVGAEYILDDTAPDAPTNVQVSSKRKFSQVTWNSVSSSVGIAYYKVFRDGFFIASTDTTSYNDRTSGGSYTYTVSAVDFNGVESPQSAPANGGTDAGGGDSGSGSSKCTPGARKKGEC